MEDKVKISGLMNYEIVNSNSNNYTQSPTSSSAESFPNLMNNGMIIEYKELEYTSQIVLETLKGE